MRDRSVIITGGSGGLGVQVTKRALESGARVVVPFISDREVERLERELGKPEQLQLVRANMAHEGEVARLFGERDRVDALIHLVGGFIMGPTEELSLADWQAHQELCLTTTFLCCKHALKRMRPSGYGRIVTIGSKAAREPMAQAAAYSAAKAGVVALTAAIAAETKGSDVTANCVLPSVIDTPQNRAAMGEGEASRWVAPESLAGVICFLASAAARDLRGAAIPVYGNV
jgi:NAD(P)-dependent dehydrogenase (short-subunit alcohol dehydrogenase family)